MHSINRKIARKRRILYNIYNKINRVIPGGVSLRSREVGLCPKGEFRTVCLRGVCGEAAWGKEFKIQNSKSRIQGFVHVWLSYHGSRNGSDIRLLQCDRLIGASVWTMMIGWGFRQPCRRNGGDMNPQCKRRDAAVVPIVALRQSRSPSTKKAARSHLRAARGWGNDLLFHHWRQYHRRDRA